MIPQEYPAFDKFWKVFTRQDRHAAKWEDTRTDREVFIRRTLHNWFVGSYFKVKEWDRTRSETDIIIWTSYIYIMEIRFGMADIDDVVISYAEPHSRQVQKRRLSYNDFLNLSIRPDDQGIWTSIGKLYRQEKIPKETYPAL